MEIKFLIVGILIITSFIYLWRVDRFQFIPLTTNFHLFGCYVYCFGTIFLADPGDSVEFKWMLYVSVALQTMLMGIIFTSLMCNFNAAQETRKLISRAWEPSTKKDISFLVLMSGFAVLLAVVFYIMIGTIVPIQALASILSGNDVAATGLAYTESRKSIHYGAGGDYYGAGYFAQFTNILIPLSFLVLAFITKHSRTKLLSFYIFLLLIFSILAMTGTGRRGVIMGFLFFLIFWSSWKGLGTYKIGMKFRITIVVGAVLLMGVLTTLMARSVESSSFSGNVLYGLWFMIERVILFPPAQEMESFKIFLASREPVYGYGWLMQLNDVLPGHRPGLAQQMHSMLGGSEHGSAGFGQYGEKYYNFGWIGATLVSFLWGCFIQWFQIKIIRYKTKGLVWIVLCYAAYLLGMAGTPIDLFNQGFITCFIFIGCYKLYLIMYERLPKKELYRGQLING